MEEKIISINSKLHFGVVFLIVAILNFLFELWHLLGDLTYILKYGYTWMLFRPIADIPFILIGLSFIIPKLKKSTLKYVSFSLLAFGILRAITVILYLNYEMTMFGLIIFCIEPVIYITAGISLIINQKYIKMCCALTFILLIIEFCYANLFGYDLYAFCFAGIGMLILPLLYIYFLSFIDKKSKRKDKPSQIKIDSNIIDFKLMLEFIEDQYKSGLISEEEYKLKRNEILNQL